GVAACFLHGHAGPHVVVYVQLQVGFNLAVDILLGTGKQSKQSQEKRAQMLHAKPPGVSRKRARMAVVSSQSRAALRISRRPERVRRYYFALRLFSETPPRETI